MVIFATAVFFSIVEQLFCRMFSLPTFEQVLRSVYQGDALNTGIIVAVCVLFSFLSLLSFLILSPLLQGANRWYYHLAESNPQPVNGIFDFFVCFRYWWKSLWLSVNVTIRSLLWGVIFELPALAMYLLFRFARTSANAYAPLLLMSLLLSIGLSLLGLVFLRIFLARYFLAKYLLSEDRTTGVREAIRASVHFMKGRWIELFVLDITLLPYYLSCIVLLPLLGVVPYVQTCKAIYAKIWMEDYLQQKNATNVVIEESEFIIQEELFPNESDQ